MSTTESTVDPSIPQEPKRYNSVNEDFLREALQNDQGEGAKLLSWITRDFTNKGDSFTGEVTCVQAKFCKGAESNQEVSYVVKLKPLRQSEESSDFDNMVFSKEGLFFTELLPSINAELTNVGLEPLRIPKCYTSKWDEGRNQLFLEDLRCRGFKMHDRMKNMDKEHATLVILELGRLHAASVLLQKKTPGTDLSHKHEFLKWQWFNYSEKLHKNFEILVSGCMKNYGRLAKALGFEKEGDWFMSDGRGKEVMKTHLGHSGNFDVVGHGDLALKNLMFRYDEKDKPVEVMLIDFQICNKASFATDLNYLLFTSLDGEGRAANLQDLITSYHGSFKSVMAAAGTDMPFSVEVLLEEFYRRAPFGFVVGAILIPILVSKENEMVDFEVASGGQTSDYVEQQNQAISIMLKNNPLLHSRYSDLFKDMLSYKVIN